MAIGYKAGTVIVVCLEKSEVLALNDDSKEILVDIQWDPLSTHYLLVAYEFHIALWDIEVNSQIQTFENIDHLTFLIPSR